MREGGREGWSEGRRGEEEREREGREGREGSSEGRRGEEERERGGGTVREN